MGESSGIGNPSGIKRIVYKEIVSGDLKKFEAQSNDSDTGGGARDLRFNPYNEFKKVFERMLTTKDGNICVGEFCWLHGEKIIIKRAQFHPPTTARPNEGRIGNVDKCIPKINISTISSDKILLLIIQREDDTTWVHFTTERSLEQDDWHEAVKNEILRGLRAKRSSRVAAYGYIDFEYAERYYNGK